MGAGNAKEKLFHAIECEDLLMAEKILDRFPNVLNEGMHKEGVLMPITRAVWRGDAKMTQLLLNRGANPDATHNNGHTALTWAAIRDRHECMNLLLKHNANIYTCDSEGFTPLDHAVINGNYPGARMLKQAGLHPKSFDFYELRKEKFVRVKVDLNKFLGALNNDLESLEHYDIWVQKPRPPKLKDPVVDPRETWT